MLCRNRFWVKEEVVKFSLLLTDNFCVTYIADPGAGNCTVVFEVVCFSSLRRNYFSNHTILTKI